MASPNVGDLAPPIDATTHDAKSFQLDSLRGRYVVIYFYPKAFTSVCTVETRLFRDHHDELTQMGVSIVGVSTDKQDTQCDFASKEGVPFSLLADPEQRIARAYGVKWPLIGIAQRVTFVLDPAGRIAARIHHELSAERHLAGVFDTLARLGVSRPGTTGSQG